MLTFTVRMRFDEPDLPGIREDLIALTHGSRAEPGCVSYICHFLADSPTTVFIYEQYRDEAAPRGPSQHPALQAARHRRPLPAHARPPD